MADQKISALTAATTPLAGTEVLPIVQSGTTVKVSVDNLTTGKNVKAASVSVGTTSTVGKVTVNGDVQAQGAFGTLSGSLGVAIGAASGTFSGNDMAVIAADAYNNYKDLIIAPRNNGSDVGDTILKSGNFKIGTAAKGINFTANTPAAGMTIQLLNWYEEGTWTPSVSFTTPGDLAVIYSAQLGKYTRIGNRVFVNCFLTLSSFTHSTASGALVISGLPFVSENAFGNIDFGPVNFNGVTKAGYTNFIVGSAWGTSDVNVYCNGSGIADSFISAADMPSGGTVLFKFSLNYQVA